MNPNYNKPIRFSNDAALLELESPVEINDYVSPVCLPLVDLYGDESAQITGYSTFCSTTTTYIHIRVSASLNLSDEMNGTALNRTLTRADGATCRARAAPTGSSRRRCRLYRRRRADCPTFMARKSATLCCAPRRSPAVPTPARFALDTFAEHVYHNAVNGFLLTIRFDCCRVAATVCTVCSSPRRIENKLQCKL